MGGTPCITAALLTAKDSTARKRLGGREIGSQLDAHLPLGAKMASYLESAAPAWVHLMPTDRRQAVAIARDIITATEWASLPR